MPNQKISDLPELLAADSVDDDALPIVDTTNSETKKIKLSSLDERWQKIGATATYFGDPDTDGSFRIFLDPPNLKIQSRISGVWTDRDTITPS